MSTTGAVYPEVAELLGLDSRRRDAELLAAELLRHPDAHFYRLPESKEDRFVTYREVDGLIQVISVVVDLPVARAHARANVALRDLVFNALIELLESEPAKKYSAA